MGAEIEDFSHGSYGDYSGVAFYGPPADGFWFDRLAVSDRYIDPLFWGALARWQREQTSPPPRVLRDWNTLEGWTAAPGITELPHSDAKDLLAALAPLIASDVGDYCAGSSPDECLRSSAAIRRFLEERRAREVRLFIEKD